MEFIPLDSRHQSYLTDESRERGFAEAICFPESVAELAEALKEASRQGLAVTIQGTRTGLFGGAVPRGGLIISLERMNGILGMSEKNAQQYLRVQAGVTLAQIESFLLPRGLFFPPDPTEKSATVGGVFASGGEGPSALRYGAAARYVEELTRVTRAGETQHIKRGDRAPDGGERIDALFGSGDSLGAAGEMTLALRKIPAEIWGLVFFFRGLQTAELFTEALRGWRENNAETLRCTEFLNSGALRLIDGARGKNALVKGLPEFPETADCAVYAELEGEALPDAPAALLELFTRSGGSDADTWAESGFSGIQKFRDMRHAVPEIIGTKAALSGGQKRPEADLKGPPEKAFDCIKTQTENAKKTGAACIIYGNLLQNHLHIALMANNG